MKIKRDTVSKYAKYLFLLAPFIPMQEYVVGKTFKNIWQLYLIVSCSLIVLTFIRKHGIKNKIMLRSLLIVFPLFVATVIPAIRGYNSAAEQAIKIAMGVFSLNILYSDALKNPKILLRSTIIVYAIATVINIITFYLFFPSMDSRSMFFYFLGNDNGSIFETHVLMSLLLFHDIKYYNKTRISTLILFVFIVNGYLFVNSGNGKVISIAMLMLSLFWKKIKKIPFKTLAAVYIIATIVLAFSSSTNIIQPILKSLGKSSTISGRTEIWEKSVDYIAKSPLVGYGIEPQDVKIQKIGINKTHNLPLEILYTGGALMAIVYLYILMTTINAAKTNRNSNLKIAMLLSIVIFLYMSIADFYIQKYTTITIFSFFYYYSIGAKNDTKVLH